RAVVAGATVTAPATLRACQTRLPGDAVLHLPARSRMEHKPQIGESFRIDIPAAHRPLFSPQPGVRDTGFAVDIGTTTVVVMLVDLVTGAILSKSGAFNGQIRFGDNVLTRIEAASTPAGLAGLRKAVVEDTLAPLLASACEKAGIAPSRIAGGTLAGNTTMLHLLLGEDPSSMGVSPFTPRFIRGRRETCGGIGLAGVAPETPAHLLPGIAAYIGADIVAGVYATGMAYLQKPSLFIDIGTNGEILLQNNGDLFGCATAAGPAFEGCGLACGTRAREGAVEDIRIRLDPFALEVGVIGGVPPAEAGGVCGSAYVDFIAQGRRCGLIEANGRFSDAAWERIPAEHRVLRAGVRAVRVAGREGPGAVVVSEVDVAVLLQAKAAIGAGIEMLLRAADIHVQDLGRVYLAGGFGMHLDVAHTIAMGLLPGCAVEQVEVVGNTSLAGAVLALIDRTSLDEMESLRSQVEVIELNLQPGFEDCYIDHLSLS
ncbi:MAG: ASKHA domain-containing protein, partial [Kiritimatiellia bacterium]